MLGRWAAISTDFNHYVSLLTCMYMLVILSLDFTNNWTRLPVSVL